MYDSTIFIQEDAHRIHSTLELIMRMFMMMMLLVMMMKLEQVPTFCCCSHTAMAPSTVINRRAQCREQACRLHAECYESQCRGQSFLLHAPMRNLPLGVRNVCRALNLQTFCFMRCWQMVLDFLGWSSRDVHIHIANSKLLVLQRLELVWLFIVLTEVQLHRQQDLMRVYACNASWKSMPYIVSCV